MRRKLLLSVNLVVAVCLFDACKTKEGPKVLPTVSTVAVLDITDSSARIQGNMPSEGSSPLESNGVCWSQHKEPTRTDSQRVSGPVFGDFEFVAKHLKNNTTYYTRAFASNGVGITYGNELSFKTEPGWLTFMPPSNPFVTGVFTINDSVVVITSHSGIYKSNNNGKTWVSSNNGLSNTKVNCFCRNTTTIYIGTEGGVFSSTDGGDSWTEKNTGLAALNINVLACSNLIVGAGTTNGLFSSSNSGNSWSPLSGLPFNDVTLLALIDNRTIAGSKATKEIYYSEGAGWTKISKDFSSDAPSGVLAFPPKVVFSTLNGLFFSSDKGNTLEKVPGLNAAMSCVNASNATIFAGGVGQAESLYASKDLGTNFSVTKNPGANTVSASCIAANNIFEFVVSGNKLYRMSL